ncbi:unnamed protein product, partial [Prunus brigantina]
RLKTEYLNFEDWTASASFVFVCLHLEKKKKKRGRPDLPRPPRTAQAA